MFNTWSVLISGSELPHLIQDRFWYHLSWSNLMRRLTYWALIIKSKYLILNTRWIFFLNDRTINLLRINYETKIFNLKLVIVCYNHSIQFFLTVVVQILLRCDRPSEDNSVPLPQWEAGPQNAISIARSHKQDKKRGHYQHVLWHKEITEWTQRGNISGKETAAKTTTANPQNSKLIVSPPFID